MQKNVGKVDQIIRIILGLALIIWGFVAHNWWGAIGIIFLGTGLIRFCPLYAPFKINTAKSEEQGS